MTPRPTYEQHLEECRLISVRLTEKIREACEIIKFGIDNWEPSTNKKEATS